MKNLETNKSANRPFGWIAVIAGIVIFITGIVLRTIQPGTIADIPPFGRLRNSANRLGDHPNFAQFAVPAQSCKGPPRRIG